MSRTLLALAAGCLLASVEPAPAQVVVVVEEAITFRNDTNTDYQVWILSEKMDAWVKRNCVERTREHYSILDVRRGGGKHTFIIRQPGKHFVVVADSKTGYENHLGWVDLRDLRCKAGADAVSINARKIERRTIGRDTYGRPVSISEKVLLPDLAIREDGRLAFYRDTFDFRIGRPDNGNSRRNGW